jgi:hypothetical protein
MDTTVRHVDLNSDNVMPLYMPAEDDTALTEMETPPLFKIRSPSWRERMEYIREQRQEGKTNPPTWVLRLMTPKDAHRYKLEWGAHLHQLIEDGEIRQARHDRRRFVFAAVTIAVALRVRRVLGQTR